MNMFYMFCIEIAMFFMCIYNIKNVYENRCFFEHYKKVPIPLGYETVNNNI